MRLEADPSSGQLLALCRDDSVKQIQKQNTKCESPLDSLLLKAFGSRSLVAARKALAALSG
jgi:hypothetical protein